MWLLGGRKSRQLVGLDIGSSSIKAVELKNTKAGYELVSYGMETLAQDTVVDGAIMDAPQVANAISQVSSPGLSSIFSRRLTMLHELLEKVSHLLMEDEVVREAQIQVFDIEYFIKTTPVKMRVLVFRATLKVERFPIDEELPIRDRNRPHAEWLLIGVDALLILP